MPKGQKFGGRKKGTPNKLTAALKDIILQALADAGGVQYLTAQAASNPAAFMALVGRVLPLQVNDGGDDPRVPVRVVHEYHPDNASV
jgi:hypothetical protein